MLCSLSLVAQVHKDEGHATLRDSLHGYLSKNRTAFDVLFYDLALHIDTTDRSVDGSCLIRFKALHTVDSIQIDLFGHMVVDRIQLGGRKLGYHRIYDAILIDASWMQAGRTYTINVHYHGKPLMAKAPPWDGGFVWSRDHKNRLWMGVACEGLGASSWWPCKDHPSDEPDSVRMSFEVPKGLMAVSNGQLTAIDTNGSAVDKYWWKVTYPINNYNLSVTLGHFVKFQDVYSSLYTRFPLNYYVLDYNLEKAKDHFRQVSGMLKAFEYYLGPYPFANDGYALIETPYVGMEHQSGIAYGNQYQRGYLGGMIPSDMDFDYIILHESAHEYWGNSVSTIDHGALWLHESFATYMESLYVEYVLGKAQASRYRLAQRPMIQNTEPMLGPGDVHFTDFKTTDIYFKGSWFLHTMRSSLHDDKVWFKFLKDFYQQHAYGPVTTADFIRDINRITAFDYRHIIKQYLTYPTLPVLEFELLKSEKKFKIKYRWQADVKLFDLRLALGPDDMLKPVTSKWKTACLSRDAFEALQKIDTDYLILVNQINE